MSWAGRSVFVTGHTGFKGGWLSIWLSRLGARVHGYALDPPTRPSLFETVEIERLLASDTRADLSSLDVLTEAISRTRAETVFHLAAQPIVRHGFSDPIATIRTNTLGTAYLLEAVRRTHSVRAVVVVSTDKVYATQVDASPHSESDPLGGDDPYSASKAASEIIVASYRSSYFAGPEGHPARVATARAGNVVGGGDWGLDRLVPDCIRAFDRNSPVVLRFPHAVRPWQHVLEPISGYVRLAERLLGSGAHRFAQAWNFAPIRGSDVTAIEVATKLARLWGDGAQVAVDDTTHWPETANLRLDASRTIAALPWRPRWTLDRALEETVAWHRALAAKSDMLEVSLAQIDAYETVGDVT